MKTPTMATRNYMKDKGKGNMDRIRRTCRKALTGALGWTRPDPGLGRAERGRRFRIRRCRRFSL